MAEEPVAAPPAEPSAPAETTETTQPAPAPTSSKPASKSKQPASNKKVARPKPRASAAGGSKKPDESKAFTAGETVLARLKGYPPWPARITDPVDLPPKVRAARPGKSPHIYCVQFFPAGDYSWLNNKEIQPLSSESIRAWLAEPHRKASGGLREAYETARDPTEWDDAMVEARRQADEAEEGVDELEEEEAEEEDKGGKRKRAAPEKKVAKKQKVEKAKAEQPKSAAKPKVEKPKQPESKPSAVEPTDDDPLASDPDCVKVKDWRHKLQRAFLGKSLPSTEASCDLDWEMATYDSLFKTIEGYSTMTIEALQYSKIGKVMKKIATLDAIPRNDELRITDRASKLMHEWQEFIEGQANGTTTQANGAKKPESAAAAPAPEKKEEKPEEKPEEKKEEVAAEGEKVAEEVAAA